MSSSRSGRARKEALAERKVLGRFYTDPEIAFALTGWGIRSTLDRFLDPSYGGCAFLQAAAVRLESLGCKEPVSQVFGVDIDGDAVEHLDAFANGRSVENFRTADFLGVGPDAFGSRFHVVAGNPPYVRHHILSDNLVEQARLALQGSPFRLPRTSGYWAYFVLHSLAFLEKGGRLAMLLPVALLNAEYAAAVRKALTESFANVRLALVKGRLVEDAEEAIVVILADGFGSPNEGSTISLLDGGQAVHEWCKGDGDGRPFDLAHAGSGWKAVLLGSRCKELLARLVQHDDVRDLGSLARVRIGVVTGANRFFVLSQVQANKLGLPASSLRFALDSGTHLHSLSVEKKDLEAIRNQGHNMRLLAVSPNGRSAAVKRYIKSSAGRIAARNAKCRQRKVWYRIVDLAVPDAFFPYVNDWSPRIVLNAAGALCTNAIHRIWWNVDAAGFDARLLALSSLTSLAGLSAEIYGRHYGGGALKLELGEVRKILIAVPKVEKKLLSSAFRQASRYLSDGSLDEARAVADGLVLSEGLGLSADEVQRLSVAQDELRSIRQG